jgi:hypothetical protein
MLKVDQIYIKRFFPNAEITQEVISPFKTHRMYFFNTNKILIVTTKTAADVKPFINTLMKFKKTHSLKYQHQIINNRNIYIVSYE